MFALGEGRFLVGDVLFLLHRGKKGELHLSFFTFFHFLKLLI